MRTAIRALLAACLTGAAVVPSALHAQAATRDEYAVWSVALDSIFGHARAKRLIVEDMTTTRLANLGGYGDYLAGRLGGGFPPAAVDSMLRASAHRAPVEEKFHTRIPVQRLSKAGRPHMHVEKELVDERSTLRIPGPRASSVSRAWASTRVAATRP
jgi:hypothetical protein